MANLSLKMLETFVEVAKTGSMTKAGKLRGTSQGSVSRQIQSLESHLGTELFRRSMALTDAGKKFLPVAEKFVKALGKPKIKR